MSKASIALTLVALFSSYILARAEESTPLKSEVIYPKAYDGFQASRDAQAYWDSRRIDAINRQVGWNQVFRDRAALAQTGTLFYAPYVPTPWAHAGGPFYDEFHWPYSVGRIFGYGFYDAVPQPIGRREVQTGPNRWESFPVYAEDVAAATDPALSDPKPTITAPPKTAPHKTASPRGREF